MTTLTTHRYVIALGAIDSYKTAYAVSALSAEHAVELLGAYLMTTSPPRTVDSIRLNPCATGTWNLNADTHHEHQEAGGLHGTVHDARLAPVDADGRYGRLHDEVFDLDTDRYLDEMLRDGTVTASDWATPPVLEVTA